MKYSILPLILIVTLICSNNCVAQNAKPKPQTVIKPATATVGINGKDLEGKWKIALVDVRMVSADGQEMKNSLPGDPADYFELKDGKMTSQMMKESDVSPYKVVGDNIVIVTDGVSDTLHVVTLTKTSCVLYRKESSPEGTAEITINLKR